MAYTSQVNTVYTMRQMKIRDNHFIKRRLNISTSVDRKTPRLLITRANQIVHSAAECSAFMNLVIASRHTAAAWNLKISEIIFARVNGVFQVSHIW